MAHKAGEISGHPAKYVLFARNTRYLWNKRTLFLFIYQLNQEVL